MKRNSGGWWIACVLACLSASASAQWTVPDPNFPSGTGPDFWVRTLALQPDGKILVGGLFTNVNGVAHPHFARLDSAGALDAAFAPQLDGEPTHFELLPDQRILISGAFTNVGGALRSGLAILHPDGSLDESFVPPIVTGLGNRLSGQLAPDGSVIVSGSFTNLSGVPQNRLARLLSNGSVDAGFSSPFDPTNTISLQVIQQDGKPIVSGSFSNLSGLSITNLVRLNTNGSVDTSFQSALQANEQVVKAWLQPDGRLLVLTSLSVVPSWFSRLVRLETNGTLDASFHTSFDFPGFPFNARITSLGFQPDGKILLGGNFLRVEGVPRASVARLESNGTPDLCFDVPLSANLFPLALAAEPAGNILVGGSFSGLQGQLHPNLMRLVPPPGCVPGVIELGVSNIVSRKDDLHVLVPLVRSGGADRDESIVFTTRDGSAVAGVDYSPVSGTLHFFPGQRSQSIAVPVLFGAASNGPVSFGVALTQAGGGAGLGTLTNTLITLTPGLRGTAGSVDTNYLVELDAPVRFVLPLSDGAAVLVGDFTNVDGQLSPNLARLRPDGTRDPAFARDVPLDNSIQSAALDSAGRLLVAGYFQKVGGVWRPGLARFGTDGSLDPSFGPFDAWTNSFGYSAQMQAVCVLADGSIVCGGSVPGTNYSSTYVLLKFSPAGQLDATFTNHVPPWVEVGALTPLADGDFFAIGFGLGGSLVRLHPDGTINFGFIPPADAQLTYYAGNGLGFSSDGRVTVAGTASAFYGLPNQPDLWRLNPDGSYDTGFSLATSFGSFGPLTFVNAVSGAADGPILVAGSFENGPIATLARFLPDGSPDLSFDSGQGLIARPNSYVSPDALAALPQGGWLLAGDFGSYDGFNQPYLVKLLPQQVSRPLTFELAVTNLTVWETNGVVTVEVLRTGDATTAASVVVSTQDGTALAGQNYTQLNTRVDFAPGEWSKIVSVPILDDNIVEPLEQFSIQLSNPTAGFTVGQSALMTIQIKNDDSGVQFVAPQFNAVQEDGYAMVGVQWSGLLSNGLTAVVNIVPLTGRSEDLGITSAVVTYQGSSTNWFRVPIVDDAIPQGIRQFRLELFGSANLIPGPQSNSVLSLTDNNFPTTPARGVAGVVEAMANSMRGGVYLAGDFTGVHGVPLNRVARLAADGEVDPGFNPAGGPDSDVTAIAEQLDGKVLIAGPFTSVNGVARAGLARLNQEGSLDATFDPGTGILNTNGLGFVRALLPQPDGTLWVAGAFTQFNNHYDRLLVRLQHDGSVDTNFVSPFTSGAVALQRGFLITSSVIYSLLQQTDGKLLAGGLMYFGTGLSVVQANVARLTADGQLDTAFSSPFTRITIPTPLAIAGTNQEAVLLGSTIYSRTGPDTNWVGLLLLQTNGLADPSFRVRGAPLMSFYESETRQLLIQPDGKIIFSVAIYGGSPQTFLSSYLPARAVVGRVLPDGTWDSTFGLLTCDLSKATQLPGPFWFNDLSLLQRQPLQPVPAAALVQQPDGILVLAGAFNSVNAAPRRRLARLDPNGALRGLLQLSLASGQPRKLLVPPEIEFPYVVETSTDLTHWSPWVQNDFPWWPIQLPLSTDSPARYFRARALSSQ